MILSKSHLQELLDFGKEQGSIVLDLKEVQLVDREIIAFLAQRESDGVTLRDCPEYIREWISSSR
ncbi:hypothetical protein L0222_19485 [bacterium]|nr:hypothetical protein [bacterium]